MRAVTVASATFTLLAAASMQAQTPAAPPQQPMGFFITSIGSGDGAKLGGLAGADKHCQELARSAGAGSRTWHAYLSSTAATGQAPVNARDRIGAGPWYNAKGALIAWNVADLHGDVHRDRNSINKEFALNEKGLPVNGRGDTPNQHDILTGSDSLDGRCSGVPRQLRAKTGRATAPGAPWSGIMIVRAAGTPHGTRRTHLVAAARQNLSLQAEQVSSTASRFSRVEFSHVRGWH